MIEGVQSCAGTPGKKKYMTWAPAQRTRPNIESIPNILCFPWEKKKKKNLCKMQNIKVENQNDKDFLCENVPRHVLKCLL